LGERENKTWFVVPDGGNEEETARRKRNCSLFIRRGRKEYYNLIYQKAGQREYGERRSEICQGGDVANVGKKEGEYAQHLKGGSLEMKKGATGEESAKTGKGKWVTLEKT